MRSYRGSDEEPRHRASAAETASRMGRGSSGSRPMSTARVWAARHATGGRAVQCEGAPNPRPQAITPGRPRTSPVIPPLRISSRQLLVTGLPVRAGGDMDWTTPADKAPTHRSFPYGCDTGNHGCGRVPGPDLALSDPASERVDRTRAGCGFDTRSRPLPGGCREHMSGQGGRGDA